MQTEADYTGDFTLDAKAFSEADNGDIIIEGLAADFNIDDQDEAFEPGAFERGIKGFLASGGPMLYHHKTGDALGQWTEARLTEDGLHVKGVMPKPADTSPLLDVYNKVKRGMIRGLSVGGKFRRRLGEDGKPRIYDSGIREISITPFPVSRNTLFSIATKAFEDDDELEQKAVERIEALLEIYSKALTDIENRSVVADGGTVSDNE